MWRHENGSPFEDIEFLMKDDSVWLCIYWGIKFARSTCRTLFKSMSLPDGTSVHARIFAPSTCEILSGKRTSCRLCLHRSSTVIRFESSHLFVDLDMAFKARFCATQNEVYMGRVARGCLCWSWSIPFKCFTALASFSHCSICVHFFDPSLVNASFTCCSIMSGKDGSFGAVGAAPGLESPISVAEKLRQQVCRRATVRSFFWSCCESFLCFCVFQWL